ncbi:MAG: recombination protein RecR [Candidatus Sungbacteria bacterium RIFCSPHIGHO2_01_FULL_47_32]|uniref:Recombination protein RecR n=1 Tax=Candidatus Sungbacteria bacterium RIFCSPHIGHO2_01_FULL_47_32 TaxID=1802264 RepID=A0A1G2K8G2_9BACT|nr:MAG: Recombination protein RecR [Parcubacteria group bacterium GW2011_GWA2_47_10]OGZ94841.1 MAG: recombination protein RecR [Candidatus Sungbacteria bacterium RIFCSPHIGHO2_01_FULL_47_32]OGZ99016.1 MAG: recombination protein RecR [Candidatus Sungbacteria bacterium RIFCSPHIGHO2_02_FULL_46_12]
MSSYPKPIQHLIELFSKFPGIGPKQAARFAFHILNEDETKLDEIARAIKGIKTEVGFCGLCYRSIEMKHKKNEVPLCEYCSSKSRDPKIVMIVEKEADLANIERTHAFNGLYHILGGTISPLDSSGPTKLHIKELFHRIQKLKMEDGSPEVILATNPTTEGDMTALYIERVLKPLEAQISRLGRGLGTGAELEYADEVTIANALTNRK